MNLYLQYHERHVARAREGNINLLFLGDSITEYWETEGLATWRKFYAPLGAAQFGIHGDVIKTLHWRIQRGELNISLPHPRVVVLMIGSNNAAAACEPAQLAAKAVEFSESIGKIIATLLAKLPATKVLLCGVLPSGQSATDNAPRLMQAELNQRLRNFDDGQRVRFLDLTSRFLQPDGGISADIMPDFLHPSAQGYAIWAEAMNPLLNEMMGGVAATG